jgi:formylglycine-generating enzyme required for sulfatase activity
MVLVEAGTFRMGDEVGDLWDETKPVHTVTLSYNYWIGMHQVTFNEYDLFTQATGRDPLYDFGWGREDRPVMRLTWWEWCHDWYGLYTADEKVNPIGAPTGHVRVMRGGSWIFGSKDCRVGNRFYRGAYDKVFRLGFRLARTGL